MKTLAKIALVLAGYLGAFLAAGLTFAFCQARAQENPAVYNSGMAAGGDGILVLAVFGAISLIPTALALYFLRSHEKFWSVFSIFSLALAATGPLAEVVNILMEKSQLSQQPLWAALGFLSLLRVGATILLAVAFLVFAILAPQKPARRRLLMAAGIEAAVFLFVVVHFMILRRTT
jgi:hypothetical protein